MLRMFNDPAKDARRILESVDYRLIRAGWEIYAEEHQDILRMLPSTPAWRILTIISQNVGETLKLRAPDVPLLKSFATVAKLYGEIFSTLERHSQDQAYLEKLFNRFPELEEAVSPSSYTPERLFEAVLAALSLYQKELDAFYQKHHGWLGMQG